MRISILALIYTLAFVAAMATLWAFLALGLMQFFESRIDSFFIVMMFALLAAMCMFSLVYGLGTGVALKWQYWLFGSLVAAALVLGVPEVMIRANLDAFQGFIIVMFGLYFGGLFFAVRRDARRVSGPVES